MTERPIVKEITFFRLDEDFIRFQVSSKLIGVETVLVPFVSRYIVNCKLYKMAVLTYASEDEVV